MLSRIAVERLFHPEKRFARDSSSCSMRLDIFALLLSPSEEQCMEVWKL